MLEIKNAKLRKLEEQDLLQVLEWRNHEDIRKWMVNTSQITYEDHKLWFERNKNRVDRFFCIFEYNEQAQGYISFQIIENSSAYEWGFYIKPNAEKGMGQLLGQAAIQYAFDVLDIQKIFGQVLAFNEKSIIFHQRLGFQQEGLLRQQFKDSRGEFDIFQFGLLKSEWLERSR